MRALWICAVVCICDRGIAQQYTPPAVVAGGKPLVAARPVTRVEDELYVPLAPVARALGASVSVGSDQMLRVRRADGLEVVYDIRTGDIRSGIMSVGHVAQYRRVQVYADADQILFPLSGLVALLGVTVHDDPDHRVLYIAPLPPAAVLPQPPLAHLSDLNYTYGLMTNGSDYGQHIGLRGQAVVGKAAIGGNMSWNRVPGRGFLSLNQGSVRAEMPGGLAMVAGDQSVYSGVDVLSNALRGGGLELPALGSKAYFYGGGAIGTASAAFGSADVSRYDTALAGFSFRRERKKSAASLGFNLFRNSQRKGVTLGASYAARSDRNQVNVQVSGGVFSGLSSRTFLVRASPPDDSTLALLTAPIGNSGQPVLVQESAQLIPVHGPAAGLSLTDTFSPASGITIAGQWDYYSRNFLTARDDSRFNSASTGTASVSWRPIQILSLNASAGRREYLLGDTSPNRTYTYGANTALPGRFAVQFGLFRSLQFDRASPLGRFSLTQYSATLPVIGRYSGYLNYSETAFGGEKIRNLNAIGTSNLRVGQLSAHYDVQVGSHDRAGADWRLSFGKREGYVRLGMDVQRAVGGTSGPLPVLGVRLPLPGGHSFQLSYTSDIRTRMLQFDLSGALTRHHEFNRDSHGMPQMTVLASVTGRVYMDVNDSGKFEPATERGIPGVRVWLDDKLLFETDPNGGYRFDGVSPGSHLIRADLAGVPAGYIFAGADSLTQPIMPYRENRLDFAVIKTGQIRGRVIRLDYAPDPDRPLDAAFPDARIVASGDHDTFSELNGAYLLGDLPPGRYELRIDPATIPPGYVAQPRLTVVDVRPGETAAAASFRLVLPPKPVLEHRAPEQRIEVPKK